MLSDSFKLTLQFR